MYTLLGTSPGNPIMLPLAEKPALEDVEGTWVSHTPGRKERPDRKPAEANRKGEEQWSIGKVEEDIQFCDCQIPADA
eukprot:343041-Hanusia_phi.AAC.1